MRAIIETTKNIEGRISRELYLDEDTREVIAKIEFNRTYQKYYVYVPWEDRELSLYKDTIEEARELVKAELEAAEKNKEPELFIEEKENETIVKTQDDNAGAVFCKNGKVIAYKRLDNGHTVRVIIDNSGVATYQTIY